MNAPASRDAEQAPADAPSRRRLLLRWVPILIGTIALIYFARQLASYWPSVVAMTFTSRIGIAVAIAALVQMASGLGDAWAWGWLMRGLDVRAPSREAMPVFLVSQFAKYVPGSISAHVGRIALGRAHGMPAPTVLLSIIIENGFALGAGALVAGASALFGVAVSKNDVSRVAWTAGIVIAAWLAGAATVRLVLAHPPAWFRRLLKLERPVTLKLSLVSGYLLIHLASYIAIGTALVIVVIGFVGDGAPEIWRVALAGMAGWFAGYILPGAPAGLGVREATLTALLTPMCGPTVAVSSALLWRASALICDGFLFVIGLIARARPTAETQ